MLKFRARFSFIAMCAMVSILLVACGRASEDDINNALNITAIPTLSADEIAQSTQQAINDEETRVAASTEIAGSPGADGSVDIAAAGNPVLGQGVFNGRCLGCHKAGGGGMGPDLSGPTSPVVAMTDQQIVDLIRSGEGHTPPGPLTTIDISDSQMPNLLAYLRQQAK